MSHFMSEEQYQRFQESAMLAIEKLKELYATKEFGEINIDIPNSFEEQIDKIVQDLRERFKGIERN